VLNPVPDEYMQAADHGLYGALRRWVSGRYVGGGGAHAVSTNAAGIGVMTLIPLWVPGSYSIDRITVEATATAATAVCRLGVYSADSNDLPTTLVLDAGTVDISSAAVVSATLDPVLALTKGLYFLGAVSQVASGTMRTLGSTANPEYVSAATAATAMGTTGTNAYLQSSVTGALANISSGWVASPAGYKVAVRVV
jgi:hypothetical protein